MKTNVIIVGPGRVGLALGYALLQAEAVDHLTVCGRRPEPPAHPLFTQGMAEYVFGLRGPDAQTRALFLAVPDGALAEMAHRLALHGDAPGDCAVFHLAGALSTAVLAPLHERGFAIGSFHPMQAIANPVTGAERLSGSSIAITGAPAALAVGRRFANALGCPVIHVPEQRRSLYHAAAVTAANYLPPLLDAACRMLERAGVGHEEALEALTTLAEGSLANIRELGLEASVTGPVARGDLETLDLHLRALEGDERRLYATFGIELARLLDGRLDEETQRTLMERFEAEKES